MQKMPLIPIDDGPIDVWYESPSIMAVKKPKGLTVHPLKENENGTLLNRLFQENRWLAQMETSVSAGVLHVFEATDHGLMLFNKNDDYQDVLTDAIANNEISFSYFITLKSETEISFPISNSFQIEKKAIKTVPGGYTVLDVKATTGNTADIRNLLFPDLATTDTTFYCYEIELILPHTGEKHTLRLRDTSKDYPNVIVYHAPP